MIRDRLIYRPILGFTNISVSTKTNRPQ